MELRFERSSRFTWLWPLTFGILGHADGGDLPTTKPYAGQVVAGPSPRGVIQPRDLEHEISRLSDTRSGPRQSLWSQNLAWSCRLGRSASRSNACTSDAASRQ